MVELLMMPLLHQTVYLSIETNVENISEVNTGKDSRTFGCCWSVIGSDTRWNMGCTAKRWMHRTIDPNVWGDEGHMGGSRKPESGCPTLLNQFLLLSHDKQYFTSQVRIFDCNHEISSAGKTTCSTFICRIPGSQHMYVRTLCSANYSKEITAAGLLERLAKRCGGIL